MVFTCSGCKHPNGYADTLPKGSAFSKGYCPDCSWCTAPRPCTIPHSREAPDNG